MLQSLWGGAKAHQKEVGGLKRPADDEGLIRHQPAVKATLVVVAPELGGDGVCFGDRHRVTSVTQTVDEGIPPVNTQPEREAAVVVAEGCGLLQGGVGAAGTMATTAPLIYPTTPFRLVALLSRCGPVEKKNLGVFGAVAW